MSSGRLQALLLVAILAVQQLGAVALASYWDPATDINYILYDIGYSPSVSILEKSYTYEEAAEIFSYAASCLGGNASEAAGRVSSLLTGGAGSWEIIGGLASYVEALLQEEGLALEAYGCDPTRIYESLLISLAYLPANGTLIPSPTGQGPAIMVLGYDTITEAIAEDIARPDPAYWKDARDLVALVLGAPWGGQEKSAGLALVLTLYMGPYPSSEVLSLVSEAPTRNLRLLAAGIALPSDGRSGICSYIQDELGAETRLAAPILPGETVALARLIYEEDCDAGPAVAAYRAVLSLIAQEAGISIPRIDGPYRGGLDLGALRVIEVAGGTGSAPTIFAGERFVLPGKIGSRWSEVLSNIGSGAVATLDSPGLREAARRGLEIMREATSPGKVTSYMAMRALLGAEILARETSDPEASSALLKLSVGLLLGTTESPLSPATLVALIYRSGGEPSSSVVEHIMSGDLEGAVRLGAETGRPEDAMLALAAARLLPSIGSASPEEARQALISLTGEEPPPPHSALDDYVEYLNSVLDRLDYYTYSDAVQAIASLFAAEPGDLLNLPLASMAMDIVRMLVPRPPPPETNTETNTTPAPVIPPQLSPSEAARLAEALRSLRPNDPIAYRIAELLQHYAETGDREALQEALQYLSQNPELAGEVRQYLYQQGGGTGGIEEEIKRLIDEGNLEEAARLLESLPQQDKERILDEIRNTDPDAFKELLDSMNRFSSKPSGIPGKPNLPSPSLPSIHGPRISLPSIGAPSLSLPSIGGGGPALLLVPLLAVAMLALYMGKDRISLAVRAAGARRHLARALARATGEGERRLSPREAVIELYRSLLESLARLYRPKRGWETHWEYGSGLPGGARKAYVDPARLYEIAKFSSARINSEDVDRMRAAVERLLNEMEEAGKK